MASSYLKRSFADHARRYSKRIEDQEEYIQEAWLRVSRERGGKTLEYYEEQGRKAIHAAYMRSWERVQKKTPKNLNGDNREGRTKMPRDAMRLYDRKYLNPKPQRLSPWYYIGEWDEYEMQRDEIARSEWFQIIVIR